MILHVWAEKSIGDGAAVMVDEFSRKMKGCVGRGPVRVMMYDVV
jgi:hypothetical protein